MTRRTHVIHTAVANAVAATAGGVIVATLFTAAGCTREERTTTARSAAQVAAASVTTTAAGQSTSTSARRSSGIKVDGRGGFDASEAQQNVLKRAKYTQEHNNDIFKPYHPSTQPTSRPASQTLSGH